MSTQKERSIKAQVIWNSTNSNSVTPTMVGSLFYDINIEKLEKGTYTGTASDLLLNDQNLENSKLDKGGYTGTAQDLKNEIEGKKASISHTHDISSITNLQTTLNNKLDKGTYTGTAQDLKTEIETKQKKLSSFDESILIESDGNIEGNISLFTEYFNQQVCELNFIPIQIIGVYQDGIKLLPEEFNITLPKTITIKTYSTEKIEIQYTHLKNN